MAKSIAIIGDSESIKGFGAVGMDRFVCEVPSESAQLLKQLTDNDYYAIIYMTEEIFEASAKEREKFAERERRLSSFVEKAVGSDILFKN